MNWKEGLSLISTIIGLLSALYYGFRHYVMDEDHYEWEKRNDGEKIFFYLVTSPIWLIVGVFKLFDWIADNQKEKSPQENIAVSNPQVKSFSMLIEDVFEIPGRGAVVRGKITKGSVSSGDSLMIIGAGMVQKVSCSGIEHDGQLVYHAGEGEWVGLLLNGIKIEDLRKGQKVIK